MFMLYLFIYLFINFLFRPLCISSLTIQNVTYNGYDFLALELRIPSVGRSASSNLCYDYQYLCEDFIRRPTGCNKTFINTTGISDCRVKYNSDMNIRYALGCKQSYDIAASVNIAFPNTSPPAQHAVNAFGFFTLYNSCSETVRGSEYALCSMRGFWQSNMTTFYTVCR